jgi:hypothetical protein
VEKFGIGHNNDDMPFTTVIKLQNKIGNKTCAYLKIYNVFSSY